MQPFGPALMAHGRRFFPRASIGAYLIAMALAVALPILAFVALLLLQLEDNERVALTYRTIRDAQALSRSADQQLQDMAATARLLSSSAELIARDYASFHDRTATALRTQSLFAILVDKEGEQLLNTRRPYGAPLGKTANIAAIRAAEASGHIEASDVFRGAISGQWVFNVTQPLDARNGAAALILTQNAQDLAKLIAIESLAPGWTAAILDSGGHVVVSVGAAKLAAGDQFSPEILSRLSDSRGSLTDGTLLPKALLGYAELPGWSWKAVVWGPVASAQQSLLTTWRFLVVGGLALLLTAILAAYAVARQVRSTILEVASMARRLGEGEIVSPVETGVIEADQVAIALSNASFDRSQTEDQLHFVMHELVHRTKNLLALAQAMIRQLSKQTTDVDILQEAITDRLDGLGRTIDMLISEKWSGISLHRVIDNHVSAFLQSPKQLTLCGDDFLLKPEAVQNLGLALHELATNSVKYGALSLAEGEIEIRWSFFEESDGEPMIELSWQEKNGPLVVQPTHTGFGTTVIKRHAAAAFGGKVQIEFLPEGLLWVLVAPRALLERV